MAEAQVEVSFSEWYEDDDDETGPWCVDLGSGIQVMRTREIFHRVDHGLLPLETKVWRDGRACWLPIAECYELTVEPALPEGVDVPEQSGLRRVARPLQAIRDSRPAFSAVALRQRTSLILAAALLCGVFLGLLAMWPYDTPSPRRDVATSLR
jgi:hypothetical protein